MHVTSLLTVVFGLMWLASHSLLESVSVVRLFALSVCFSFMARLHHVPSKDGRIRSRLQVCEKFSVTAVMMWL